MFPQKEEKSAPTMFKEWTSSKLYKFSGQTGQLHIVTFDQNS